MPQTKKTHPPHASQDRFDASFRLAPIGVVVGDLDGKILSANPAMCQMLGYTEAEIVGRKGAELTTPELAAATAALRKQLLDPASGGTGVIEKCYTHKQGHKIWGIVNIHLHRSASGAPDFFVAHVQDITKRKRAEAILRESEEKFRVAFENAPVGMGIVGPTGRFLDVNPALCGMLGYPREELLASTFNDVTHPEDIERGNRWLRKLLAGDFGEPELEKRYLHKDGRLVWGLVRAQWVRSADTTATKAVVHVTDITERKRAEAALLDRERQLREAHEIAQMGHWRIALPAGTMHWGDDIFRLLEFDPATTVPSQELLLSRLHPDDLPTAREALEAAREVHEPWESVFRLRFPDGRVKHLRAVFRTERGTDGRPVQVTGIAQDISILREAEEQRAQLEEQLERARRMEAIGYLAGGIAHDFNNLLTVIGGNASLAQLDADRDSRLGTLMSEIAQAVASGANLTRQLLAFSRKQVIEPKVMSLNERIEHLTPILRRLLGEHLELETVLAPALGPVHFDPTQAEQILINLAVNARDAMPNGGRLIIRTANVEATHEPGQGTVRASGPFVLLEVTDTGTGMSEEVRQHLFEPFFTTKEPGRGTGLGLAVVYGAVTQNQGHIAVSSALGRGSTFRIYLPRLPGPENALRPPAEPINTAGHETILFVEDDPAVRSLGERVLVRRGYRVRACASGAEALSVARDQLQRVDLLVTDVVMPGMNGRALADELRRSLPSLKVLFTSGYTQDVIGRNDVLAADTQFLAKPYSFEDLARRVRETLG